MKHNTFNRHGLTDYEERMYREIKNLVEHDQWLAARHTSLKFLRHKTRSGVRRALLQTIRFWVTAMNAAAEIERRQS